MSGPSMPSPAKKLRRVSRQELEMMKKSDDIQDIQDISDPLRYHFQPGELVWVKTTSGQWTDGIISSVDVWKGPLWGDSAALDTDTQPIKEALYYLVVYSPRRNVRRYVAPLNGEVKPDNARTRKLLWQVGFTDFTRSD
ncbi:hypothetical protein C8J56DRAFT_1040783 [Mycena floridula]|nr:hypothetical protein C8J56DRAFT_1040783 [Mycena floridula]